MNKLIKTVIALLTFKSITNHSRTFEVCLSVFAWLCIIRLINDVLRYF